MHYTQSKSVPNMNSSIDGFRVRTIKTITRAKTYGWPLAPVDFTGVVSLMQSFKKFQIPYVESLTEVDNFQTAQPGKIETDKNAKSSFFLLGLKYTLRTCFEP